MKFGYVHPADYMRILLSATSGAMAYWGADSVTMGMIALGHLGFSGLWLFTNLFSLIDQDHERRWAYAPATLDITAITLLSIFTGAGNSIFVVGYLAITAISSLHPGVRQGFFAFALSSLCFAAMIWLVYFDVLPEVNVLGAGNQTSLIFSLLATIVTTLVLYTTHRVVDNLVQRNQKLLHQVWSEMELARRIQTALLPDRPALPGYDLAAYMSPADQVGGDYYDVIPAAGMDWIVIGDVSGHGVPAGLIMMMVQTAVRTAVTQNPACTPQELLEITNRVIYDNIRKLDEKRYVTITALATHAGGSFYFSGIHQDILIRRAARQNLETVETSGMWLGVLDDIAEDLDLRELTLESGDVMLLYTDGIPEATNENGEMYSHERLAENFEKLANRSPREIVQTIVDELKDYKLDDDVTMIVIRRD